MSTTSREERLAEFSQVANTLVALELEVRAHVADGYTRADAMEKVKGYTPAFQRLGTLRRDSPDIIEEALFRCAVDVHRGSLEDVKDFHYDGDEAYRYAAAFVSVWCEIETSRSYADALRMFQGPAGFGWVPYTSWTADTFKASFPQIPLAVVAVPARITYGHVAVLVAVALRLVRAPDVFNAGYVSLAPPGPGFAVIRRARAEAAAALAHYGRGTLNGALDALRELSNEVDWVMPLPPPPPANAAAAVLPGTVAVISGPILGPAAAALVQSHTTATRTSISVLPGTPATRAVAALMRTANVPPAPAASPNPWAVPPPQPGGPFSSSARGVGASGGPSIRASAHDNTDFGDIDSEDDDDPFNIHDDPFADTSGRGGADDGKTIAPPAATGGATTGLLDLSGSDSDSELGNPFVVTADPSSGPSTIPQAPPLSSGPQPPAAPPLPPPPPSAAPPSAAPPQAAPPTSSGAVPPAPPLPPPQSSTPPRPPTPPADASLGSRSAKDLPRTPQHPRNAGRGVAGVLSALASALVGSSGSAGPPPAAPPPLPATPPPPAAGRPEVPPDSKVDAGDSTSVSGHTRSRKAARDELRARGALAVEARRQAQAAGAAGAGGPAGGQK